MFKKLTKSSYWVGLLIAILLISLVTSRMIAKNRISLEVQLIDIASYIDYSVYGLANHSESEIDNDQESLVATDDSSTEADSDSDDNGNHQIAQAEQLSPVADSPQPNAEVSETVDTTEDVTDSEANNLVDDTAEDNSNQVPQSLPPPEQPPSQQPTTNQPEEVAFDSTTSEVSYSLLPTKEEGCYRSPGQYIATTSETDTQGPLLKPIEVIRFGFPDQTRTEYVHRCIYDLSKQMLDDFNSQQTDDRYKLGFWGWRSYQRQVELRSINGCPDRYQSPASSCDTPTAIPGTGNHQDGLALDFYCTQGAIKGNNCNRALAWMRCHAADYGFVELKSEGWHWDYYTQVRNGANRLVKEC